jgi:hypothetical protein
MLVTLAELQERIARLADEELLYLVQVEAAHYRPEALAFAEAEITRRGLARDLPVADEEDADEEDEEDEEDEDQEEAPLPETASALPTPAEEPDWSAQSDDLPSKEARLSVARFRMLIFLAQLATLFNYTAPSVFDGSVPPEVEAFVLGRVAESDDASLLFTRSVLAYYTTIALDILSFGAALGLLVFRRWARTLLLCITIARLLFTPATPVYLNTGGAVMIGYAASLLEGMVLALCYFASPKGRFEQPPAE